MKVDMLTEVISTIIENKFDAFQRLIDKGIDVNMTAEHLSNKSFLHFAIEQNRLEMVSYLIKKKINVNSVTIRKFTPMHVAAQKGSEEFIEILANAGAKINEVSDVGCTPLHEAAAKGHKKVVLKLLALKADPNIKDSLYNLTAANLAHENGYESVRDILVSVMTYQQSFIQNINFILFNWKRNFLTKSVEYKFIESLVNSMKSLEDGDEVFKKISDGLKSQEYKKLSITLVFMRQSIVDNMKSYNQEKINFNTKKFKEESNEPTKKPSFLIELESNNLQNLKKKDALDKEINDENKVSVEDESKGHINFN
jgi:hypothetical protein